MVNRKNVCLIALGIASVLGVIPSRAMACSPPELRGRVKSIIVTEALVDPVSGKIGEARLASRTDISTDGGTVETTLYSPRPSAEPTSKFTAYFENGRVTRQVEVANGKIVSTKNCSYDSKGRLVEARMQSDKGERNMVETYEYGSGFIRHRAKTFSGWTVINQTIDALGRVVKEEVLDETGLTVEQTTHFTYNGTRHEQCWVYLNDPRRPCNTTVRDSQGNETEFVAEGQSRKTSLEYDSVGNWVSKRTAIIGPQGTSVETIVQRKIEYW